MIEDILTMKILCLNKFPKETLYRWWHVASTIKDWLYFFLCEIFNIHTGYYFPVLKK